MPTRRRTDEGEADRDWTPERGVTRVTPEKSNWIKLAIAPVLSALLTGLAMYVAVRVEVAQLSVRQEMTLRSLDELAKGIHTQNEEMTRVRERLSALETLAKK